MANYTPLPREEESETANVVKYSAPATATTADKGGATFKPQVPTPPEAKHETKSSTSAAGKSGGAAPPPVATGWTVDGVPVGGPMVQRAQWETSLFSCHGRNDEFYSSDLEVCVLGSVAPCVLHGSNVERLGSAPGSFANHCLPYAGLYLMGNCFFGWNCLAPWYSYPNRTAIRHKFNLEVSVDGMETGDPVEARAKGNCEAITRTFGCPSAILMDEAQREQCESNCDFAAHVFCHTCALCQEAREVRRKMPHPGFSASPLSWCFHLRARQWPEAK